MQIIPLEIPDVIYIVPDVYRDHRGYFFESYHAEKLRSAGITLPFVQDNQSRSEKGTLRGLHYQLKPAEQGKLVRVLSGKIWDVAVDIRKGSPTFGKWVAKYLSSEHFDMLYIPPGFAHGFYVLSDTAEVFYKCTELYTPQLDRGIAWNDPAIGIDWPLESDTPKLSSKDMNASLLANAEII